MYRSAMASKRAKRWSAEAPTQRTVTTHPLRDDPGQWVASVDAEESGWHVTTHWFAVDGQVIPAGIDIRAFSSEDGSENAPAMFGQFTTADTPQAVTRVGINDLGIGRIVEEHRGAAWRRLRERAEQLRDWPDVAPTLRELLDGMEQPPTKPTAQENRRRAATLMLQLGKPGEVARRMQADGVLVRGEPVSTERVRRWIREAQASGLMEEIEKEMNPRE
jgi:hypothetical protein